MFFISSALVGGVVKVGETTVDVHECLVSLHKNLTTGASSKQDRGLERGQDRGQDRGGDGSTVERWEAGSTGLGEGAGSLAGKGSRGKDIRPSKFRATSVARRSQEAAPKETAAVRGVQTEVAPGEGGCCNSEQPNPPIDDPIEDSENPNRPVSETVADALAIIYGE